MKNYVKIQTTDNTTVYLRKEAIAAMEEIPGTSRAEGYLKLYVTGYSFGVRTSAEELLKQMGEG